MTIQINAEKRSARSVLCDFCKRAEATRIQMTAGHKHDKQNHWVVCSQCRSDLGLELCECCEMSEPYQAENGDGIYVDLWPAYGPGELSGDGDCSIHP